MNEEATTDEQTIITEDELQQSITLFNEAYPYFIDEIERVESMRGKLNEFQLMRAVSRAKQRLEIIGWNCRKTVNALYEAFVDIYKESGKEEALSWAEGTFGANREHVPGNGAEGAAELTGVSLQIVELKLQIQAKEAELQQLYDKLVELQITNE